MASPSFDPERFKALEADSQRVNSVDGGIGTDLIGELVKSFGVKHDNETGWSWSTDNIVTAFKDHPFWTTLDYVTLALPVAKWGMAAADVARGATWAGRAYKAGELGLTEAMAERASMAPRTAVGRYFSATGEAVIPSPEKLDMMKRFGSVPGEVDRMDMLGIKDATLRELRASNAAIERRGQDLIQRTMTFSEEDARNWVGAMTTSPTKSPEEHARFFDALTPSAAEHYQITADFRNGLHNLNYNLGLISEDTWLKQNEIYLPRINEGYVARGSVNTNIVGGGSDLSKARPGYGRFGRRTLSDEEAASQSVLNPAVGINELARAAMVANRQVFANKLVGAVMKAPGEWELGPTRSILVKSSEDLAAKGIGVAKGDEVWPRMGEVFPGNPEPRKPTAVTSGERVLRLLNRDAANHVKDWRQLQDIDALAKGRGAERVQDLIGSLATKGEGMKMRAAVKLALTLNEGQDVTASGGTLAMSGLKQLAQDAGPAAQRTLGRIDELGASGRRLVGTTASEWSDTGRGVEATEQARAASGASLAVKVSGAMNRTSDQAIRQANAVLTKRGLSIENSIGRVEGQIARAWENAKRSPLLRHMPDGTEDLYVDPALAKDLQGMFHPQWDNFLARMYYGVMSAFKVSHTVLNPGTHVQNTIGNLPLQSFVNGFGKTGFDFLAAYPRGFSEFKKGRGFYLDRLVGTGLMDTGHGTEINDFVRASYGDVSPGKGVQWLEERLSGTGLQKFIGAGAQGASIARSKAGYWYRSEDNIARLGAYMQAYDRFAAQGMDDAAATARAALELARYMPNYSDVSPFVRQLRAGVPFASFQFESVRIWKNAMIYKPHMAFYWQHIFNSASSVFGAMAGISASEREAAEKTLPWYAHGKMMMMLPFRSADGKPQFWDASNAMPGAAMGQEADLAENSFFGLPLPNPINFGSNPFVGAGAVALTGKDPFTGHDVTPRFTEGTLGINVPERGYKAIGLAEHSLRLLVPPLVLPGYAGVNLLDLARGTKSPVTGQAMQEGVIRTVLANVAGMRSYEPKVTQQISNIHHEQQLVQAESSHHWARWALATANGNYTAANEQLQEMMKTPGMTPAKLLQGIKMHMPGSFTNVSSKVIQETQRRAATFAAAPAEIAPVYIRGVQTSLGGRR